MMHDTVYTNLLFMLLTNSLSFVRYFFNTTTNQCDCFLYGGCPSERIFGSYVSLNECIDRCSPDNHEEGQKCKKIFKEEYDSFPVKPQEEVIQNDKRGHHQAVPQQPRPGTVGGVPFPDTSRFSNHEIFAMLERSTIEDRRQLV